MTTALQLHRNRLRTIRTRTGLVLAKTWDPDSTPEAFAEQTTPMLRGAKAATVAASAAFYARQLRIPPVGVTPDLVLSEAATRDTFTAYWHALSMQRPWTEAVEVGRTTADAVGQTFIQSTSRLTGDAVAATVDRPVRWRRVAEGGSCEWCSARNGRTYDSSADGDYGHQHCHCDVVPA